MHTAKKVKTQDEEGLYVLDGKVHDANAFDRRLHQHVAQQAVGFSGVRFVQMIDGE